LKKNEVLKWRGYIYDGKEKEEEGIHSSCGRIEKSTGK
jgi:hypothetical protein